MKVTPMTTEPTHADAHDRDRPAAATAPDAVLLEAVVYWTNYETGDVYLPGDQFTESDPLLVNTVVGIGFARLVGASEPPPDPGDVTRRRRGRPPHVTKDPGRPGDHATPPPHRESHHRG
jgi:hypothetical protein